MASFFFRSQNHVYLAECQNSLNPEQISILEWLLDAKKLDQTELEGDFIGPRREMITPWSTNAVEIALNTGVSGISRIEAFRPEGQKALDPMLEQLYQGLQQNSLEITQKPAPIEWVEDIESYNREMGLALSEDEIEYLKTSQKQLGRPFTDSEIFGFAQVNSEHCRHKIFNGEYVMDGAPMEQSLFGLIKNTTKANPNTVITRYNDNVSFIDGDPVTEFIPKDPSKPSFFNKRKINAVYSLKAETHNFPTTVEPINGAATGSGGEIRDRMAGGRGSLPLAGTACYMTSYPRLANRPWEKLQEARPWLYQTPQQILTKASNGASDFGNKFGQPLINGSTLTFEHKSKEVMYGFDKTIMLAGGIGYAQKEHALKLKPDIGDKIILLGGDNYRIGMGGGAVSSVDTGAFAKTLELNAVQRANPEMQKRALNCIRGLLELAENPIILIHDHGAGGHINCLSELVEEKGGVIYIKELPKGDPSLSDKELIGNESQERMGLVVKEKDVELLRQIAERERSPMYVIGTITGDNRFTFENPKGEKPVDISLDFLFGKPPKTVINADKKEFEFENKGISGQVLDNIKAVLQVETVACKDWLTNKVDRSVTGKVLQQQCVGPLQLPLNGSGVMSIDPYGSQGLATAMGTQPQASLLNSEAGTRLAISESLLNLVFTPLKEKLKGVTLSANWMWPCKNPGEDERLYRAVKAASEFSIALGINISTGKDSLSMVQKYPESEPVRAPGTLIVSAMGSTTEKPKIITPDLKPNNNSQLLYINFSGMDTHPLGGSVLAQTQGHLGDESPDVTNIEAFAKGFDLIQAWLPKILAGQDVSAGGLASAALEMAFAGNMGVELKFELEAQSNLQRFLFNEKPALLVQLDSSYVPLLQQELEKIGLSGMVIGQPLLKDGKFILNAGQHVLEEDITLLRDLWFEPSFLLEEHQTLPSLAKKRFENYAKHPLQYKWPQGFASQSLENTHMDSKPVAAIIREKGTNGEREMAFSLFQAGFKVKDVMMTDLTSGRETLEDVHFIVFCGGFSNSDVLGSARGWAGVFKYNPVARKALENFYERPDTLSLGVCNGCQLMVLLNLIQLPDNKKAQMLHNASGKFESAFVQVSIPHGQKSIMLKGLEGSELGIWVAHGEGRFYFPEEAYPEAVALQYSYSDYPQNPNGSQFDLAGISSDDGRHLAMMPHLERSIFSWQWPYLPENLKSKHNFTPWLQAFINAKLWIESKVRIEAKALS